MRVSQRLTLGKVKYRPMCLECLTPLTGYELSSILGGGTDDKVLENLIQFHNDLIPVECEKPDC